MHRVDTPGNLNGLFFDGNPAAGQPATQLLAAWFNDVQENIARVIEDAGIELAKGEYTQLSDAIVAIVAGAVGAGGASVPTTRLVNGGGLVTGGGNLAVDRTLTVTAASAAEVASATRNDVAITPLSLLGGSGARLLQATGYATLFGILFQWGTATAAANGTTNVVLPTTFPNQCVFADFSGGSIVTNAQYNDPVVVGQSVSAISVFSARDDNVVGRYLAIGF